LIRIARGLGSWELRAAAARAGHTIELRNDRHFFCTVREFAAFAQDRKALRMETFYRQMRRRHGVLMDGDKPAGDPRAGAAAARALRRLIHGAPADVREGRSGAGGAGLGRDNFNQENKHASSLQIAPRDRDRVDDADRVRRR
jgi:hypothetical protein